ncbi:MAG: acyl-CoA dehydrogenase [Proteobacteria bacterium]|nr:acyl-CoA dehydrogenase [Pseudomonadota bacterium]
MEIRFTPEEEKFRMEVRDFMKKEVPQRWKELGYTYWEEDDESWEITKAWNKKLGQKGWLALSWPKKYGGQEATDFEQLIFDEEMYHQGRTPTWIEKSMTIDWIGPTIMMFGSEEQKNDYLPRSAKGEITFCLGYSEPDSGSDLASLKTSATEEGDRFVVNGQKIWTTQGHRADYCWLAARTNPEAPPHKGISMLIVDMKTPGITVRPIVNMLESHSFNEVFFDNVHVPKENLVGKLHNGWYQMMVALTFERGLGGFPIQAIRMIKELVQYCKETTHNGELLAENPRIRDKLARLAVEAETVKLLNYRITWMQSKEMETTSETSIGKALSANLFIKLVNIGMQILGPYSQLDRGSKWAPLKGTMARWYLNSPSMGLGGGTNEIQYNIIAQRGLGLPVK